MKSYKTQPITGCEWNSKKNYKILLNNKRYNTKTFNSYELARAYVRRLVTRLQGSYSDSYTQFGFKVERC